MKFVSLLIFIAVLASCNNTSTSKSAANAKEEIKKVMKMQEEAWNNGDLKQFMEGYWKNDSLKFVGSKGITYGWETTLNNYIKSYPDTTIMGKLHFDIDLIEKLGEDTYYLIGRYKLQRDKDEPSGYFNLIWKSINGEWKIITDMTCG